MLRTLSWLPRRSCQHGRAPGLYSERWLRARQAVQRFAVADLSNWYLDVAKDRLYVRDAACADRRACQTVMHALLQACLIWLQR